MPEPRDMYLYVHLRIKLLYPIHKCRHVYGHDTTHSNHELCFHFKLYSGLRSCQPLCHFFSNLKWFRIGEASSSSCAHHEHCKSFIWTRIWGWACIIRTLCVWVPKFAHRTQALLDENLFIVFISTLCILKYLPLSVGVAENSAAKWNANKQKRNKKKQKKQHQRKTARWTNRAAAVARQQHHHAPPSRDTK